MFDQGARGLVISGIFILMAFLLLIFSGSFSAHFYGAIPAYAQPAQEQVVKPKISFKDGPGDTPESAVVISGAPNSMEGIQAEYYYLKKKFGAQNVAWKLKRQGLLRQKGKVYDRMDLELQDGSQKTVFFDISEFFGKL